MIQRYAQIVGLVVLLLGVGGLLLGERSLLGALNIDIAEDVVHIVTGGLLAYLGFTAANVTTLRTTVGVIGMLYLLVGVIGFFAPTLFGLLPHGYSIVDNLVHLALGLATVWVASRAKDVRAIPHAVRKAA
jgi:hypothetical protein